jgi:hypothetical protein
VIFNDLSNTTLRATETISKGVRGEDVTHTNLIGERRLRRRTWRKSASIKAYIPKKGGSIICAW